MLNSSFNHCKRLLENITMNYLRNNLRAEMRWMAVTLLAASIFLAGCGGDNAAGNTNNSIEIPSVAYVFDSRFNEGESSVAYAGQVVRNLLIQDLKSFIDRLAEAGAQPIGVQDLLNFYEYDDGLDLVSLSNAGAKPVVENRYSAISTGKNLVGKISGDLVIGYDRTADELIRGWFEVIAAQSQDADKLGTPAVYTDHNGVDLSHMINKVLIGAVPYFQSTGVYLDGLLANDNAAPRSEGSASTAMEHAWDEAFGYFGAARDYGRYSDTQLAGGVDDFASDSNGDGRIDFTSEYNFGLSRNAAKRDGSGRGVDFTREIFNAFLTGRSLIANQGTVSEIAAQRQLAANGMEQVIAATVVHYINDTLSDMADLVVVDGNGTGENGTAENRVNLNKHWAEMKGFTVALQYSPLRLIGAGELKTLHGIMGLAPRYETPGSNAYNAAVSEYQRAKQVLQEVYGFSADNMAGW